MNLNIVVVDRQVDLDKKSEENRISLRVIMISNQNASYSIAMVTRIFSGSGGLELYTHNLVEGLLARGHQVTVICEENHSELVHENLTVRQFAAPPKKFSKGERLDYYFVQVSQKIRDLGHFDVVHSQHLAIENADVAHFHNHTIRGMIKRARLWERCVREFKLKVIPGYIKRDKYDQLSALTGKVLMFPSLACKNDFEETYNLPMFRDLASHIVAYPGASLKFHDQEHSKHIRNWSST